MEDMCYEIRRTGACVDQSHHHTLVNVGERDTYCVKGGWREEGDRAPQGETGFSPASPQRSL